MKKIILSSSPGISVSFNYQEGYLHSTDLELSPEGFVCYSEENLSASLLEWLHAYAHKKPLPFPESLFLPFPSFTQKALRTLQQVPFGTFYSYGDFARTIGHPKAARAIGQACHKNPFPFLIPCHRIIGAHGALGGFSINKEIKKVLINYETTN